MLYSVIQLSTPFDNTPPDCIFGMLHEYALAQEITAGRDDSDKTKDSGGGAAKMFFTFLLLRTTLEIEALFCIFFLYKAVMTG